MLFAGGVTSTKNGPEAPRHQGRPGAVAGAIRSRVPVRDTQPSSKAGNFCALSVRSTFLSRPSVNRGRIE